MPRPLNAEEGDPNAEVPHGARTYAAPTESRPDTRRLSDTEVASLKRKMEEVIHSAQAAMDKLKSKWRRIEEGYHSIMRAVREGISSPHEKVAELEELCKEAELILLFPGGSRQDTTALVRRGKTSPSVIIELVGKETHQKVNEIFSYLMQDSVSIIGVCLLYGHLNVKNRSILILDGLWMHFEVKDVGIPVETGKLKLVVTTRSLDVCRMMLCQKQIKIGLLDMEDSWRLFPKMLCFAGRLPCEVERIVRYLLHRCYGLPLGIIEIATRMRREKVLEWRGMLGKLVYCWMQLDVLKRLQLSYLNLGNDKVQQCFLHLVFCFGKVLSRAQETPNM